MSTKQTPTSVTPESRLKDNTISHKNYFTYPKSKHAHNAYSQSTDPSKPTDDSIKPEVKIKTVNNVKYRSISNSPSISLSSSSSNDAYSSSSPTNQFQKWYCNASNWIKILIIMILLTTLIIAAIFNHTTLKYSQQFLNWMDQYPVKGSFAYIGLYIICSVCLIPGSILTLGAGFVYVKMFGQLEGVILASAVVWFGASIGSIFAFVNSRYLLRNLVEYYTQKSTKFALIDNVVGLNGFKVTFLLRLSPITPYNVFNYFMGLTSVKLSHYSFACIAMIPDAVVYCFIGGSIASIAKLSSVGFASDPILLTVTVVGSIAAICGVIYISYIAKKEFDKMALQHSISILAINNRDNVEEKVVENDQNEYMLNVGIDPSMIVPIHDVHDQEISLDLENDGGCCVSLDPSLLISTLNVDICN